LQRAGLEQRGAAVEHDPHLPRGGGVRDVQMDRRPLSPAPTSESTGLASE
jgi:hypothetical protein